ncbi:MULTISPECIES: hypothetical protein [unclassified Frankia]
MASVIDGIYRISIAGQQTLTDVGGGNLVLLPDGDGDGQVWQVQRADDDTYTIRKPSGGAFVGFDGDPDAFERVRVLPEPREWKIAAGPQSGTFTIGVPDNELTLGLHPALIYPPLVALSPIFSEDRGWIFEGVE